MPDSDAFRRWFGKSVVIDPATGLPRTVHHGSRNEFDAFHPSWIGSASDEGFYGHGFYFSPAEEEAREYGPSRPFHLRLENPFRVPSSGSFNHASFFDLRDALAALDPSLSHLKTNRELPPDYELREDEQDHPYFPGQKLKKFSVYPTPPLYGTEREKYGPEKDSPLEAITGFHEMDSEYFIPQGWATGLVSHVGRDRFTDMLKKAGYDGVVTFDPDSGDEQEYVAFDPRQIKSTTNRGTYDPEDPRFDFEDDPMPTPYAGTNYASHEDFLRKIAENSHEGTSAMVYADWLEENGHPAAAEVIRRYVDHRMNHPRGGFGFLESPKPQHAAGLMWGANSDREGEPHGFTLRTDVRPGPAPGGAEDTGWASLTRSFPSPGAPNPNLWDEIEWELQDVPVAELDQLARRLFAEGVKPHIWSEHRPPEADPVVPESHPGEFDPTLIDPEPDQLDFPGDEQYSPNGYARYSADSPVNYSHKAFVSKIAQDPHEGTHAAAYIDWLEENGYPEIAAVVRGHMARRAELADKRGVPPRYSSGIPINDSYHNPDSDDGFQVVGFRGSQTPEISLRHFLSPVSRDLPDPWEGVPSRVEWSFSPGSNEEAQRLVNQLARKGVKMSPFTDFMPIPEMDPVSDADEIDHNQTNLSRYAGTTPTNYADLRTIRAILKQIRENPYDADEQHMALADALEEYEPGNPVSVALRRQYGLGEFGQHGPRENLWNETVSNSWDGTFPHTFPAGKSKVFNLHLGGEGRPGQNPAWTVHAVSNLPGLNDTGYTFEYPIGEANQLASHFPNARAWVDPNEGVPEDDRTRELFDFYDEMQRLGEMPEAEENRVKRPDFQGYSLDSGPVDYAEQVPFGTPIPQVPFDPNAHPIYGLHRMDEGLHPREAAGHTAANVASMYYPIGDDLEIRPIHNSTTENMKRAIELFVDSGHPDTHSVLNALMSGRMHPHIFADLLQDVGHDAEAELIRRHIPSVPGHNPPSAEGWDEEPDHNATKLSRHGYGPTDYGIWDELNESRPDIEPGSVPDATGGFNDSDEFLPPSGDDFGDVVSRVSSGEGTLLDLADAIRRRGTGGGRLAEAGHLSTGFDPHDPAYGGVVDLVKSPGYGKRTWKSPEAPRDTGADLWEDLKNEDALENGLPDPLADLPPARGNDFRIDRSLVRFADGTTVMPRATADGGLHFFVSHRAPGSPEVSYYVPVDSPEQAEELLSDFGSPVDASSRREALDRVYRHFGMPTSPGWSPNPYSRQQSTDYAGGSRMTANIPEGIFRGYGQQGGYANASWMTPDDDKVRRIGAALRVREGLKGGTPGFGTSGMVHRVRGTPPHHKYNFNFPGTGLNEFGRHAFNPWEMARLEAEQAGYGDDPMLAATSSDLPMGDRAYPGAFADWLQERGFDSHAENVRNHFGGSGLPEELPDEDPTGYADKTFTDDSPIEVDGFEVDPHLFPEERDRLLKAKGDTQKNFRDMLNKGMRDEPGTLPTLSEITSLAQMGDPVRGSYDDAYRTMEHIFGNPEDAQRWVTANAILSAQTGWVDHTIGATEALARWIAAGRPTNPRKLDTLFGTTGNFSHPKTGKETWGITGRGEYVGPDTLTGHKVQGLKNIFGQGEDFPGTEWDQISRQSFKTPNFGLAFVDPRGVPIDTHMAKMMSPEGFGRDDILKIANETGVGKDVQSELLEAQKKLAADPASIMAYKALVSKAADDLGWEPREVQEAVWVASLAVSVAKSMGASPRTKEILSGLSRKAVQAGWSLNTVLTDPRIAEYFDMMDISPRRISNAVQRSQRRLPAGAGRPGTSDFTALESVAARLPGTVHKAAIPIRDVLANGG